MSDTGDSSVSLDWAFVDHEGSVPDDATSTASSVEVVDDDDEEEESFDSHGTPLAGSPNNNMPRFVLRLPSRSSQNVSDTDDEPSDVSNGCVNNDASIVSVPESLPSSSEPSVSSSEHSMAGQTYRQMSSNARISREDIEDLCDKIDTLKKTLVPAAKTEEDLSTLNLLGDKRPNTAGTSNESDRNLPRVENLQPCECPDGDASMQSSVSSSYSFLSRDTVTEVRTDKDVEADAVNGEPQPLLVEQLLDQQEPATREDVKDEEEQDVDSENLNDMLQVEQGQHYLQTFVSHFIDYRDIIRWVIGFGSYTGLVVATVIYFSAPAPVPPCQSVVPKESYSISDLSTGPKYCHGDECSSGPDKKHLDGLMKLSAESDDRIKELKDKIEADEHHILKLIGKQEKQEGKIRATKTAIKNLRFELSAIMNEKDILEDRKEYAIDGWKKEWQDGLLKVAELQKFNLALEAELTDTTHDKDHLQESLRLCQSRLATEEEDKNHDDDLAKQAERKLDVFKMQCKNDIDNIEGRCKADLSNVRGQCQSDIDRVKSQCQSDLSNVRFEHHVNLENLKNQHKVDMDNLKWQSDKDLKKAHKSCQKPNQDEKFKRSAHSSQQEQSDHDRTSYSSHRQTEADDDDGDKEESHEDIPFSFAQWTGTVLEMMNSTKHQIVDTWAKVKNVSESLWQEHEPTIRNLQQSFAKKIVRLNEKFQEKVARKLNKWFGRKKRQGGAAKTSRKEFEKDLDSGSPPTIEQRLVKQSYRVNAFTAKSFRKTYQKNVAKLESIQAEFKDIDATMKIPKTYEEKIKWKDYILTDQHLKWLRCQQKFWEDFMNTPHDCFKELCCWQVKIADGNVKACRKYKRRHGMDDLPAEAGCPVMREFTDCGTVTSDSMYEAHTTKHRLRRDGKVTPLKAATLHKRFKGGQAAKKDSPSKRTQAKSKKMKRNEHNMSSSTIKSSEKAAKKAATSKKVKKTLGNNKEVKSSSKNKSTTKKTTVTKQSAPKNKRAESPRKPNTPKRAAAPKQVTPKNKATKSASKSASPKRSTAAKQATAKNVAAKTTSRAKPATQKKAASPVKRSSRSRR